MNPEPTPTNFYGGKSASWRVAALTLAESVYPANLKMPVHQHEPVYFGLVLRGGYTETVAMKTRQCKQLTTVFHPQGESHAVAFHTDTHIFRVELSDETRERIGRYATLQDEGCEFHGGLLASLALRLYNEYRKRDQ